jgi:uncharacterized protein
MNSSFIPFCDRKYLSLESFKKNGAGVRTPVWFAADPATPLGSATAKIYIYTIANTGKVKRIRNNPHVRIAPSDMRGKSLGQWVKARADVVNGEDAEYGMRLLRKKYRPLIQIMGFFARFSRNEHVVMAIRPA